MTTLPPDEYAEFHTSRNRAAQEEITDLSNNTNVDEDISAFDAGHGAISQSQMSNPISGDEEHDDAGHGGISQSQMSNPISGDEGHDDGSETNDAGDAGAD